MSGFDVFVSYRTVDARFGAAAGYEALADRFGGDRVFLDHASMEPGEPYPASIRAALEQARVLVVLIGPEWLSTQADTGVRLVDLAGDWVRREIRRGLERRIVIIPVLLDGTPLPLSAELPDDIRDLVKCQVLEVRHRSLRADLNRLGNAVARWTSLPDGHEQAAGDGATRHPTPDTTLSAVLGSGAGRFAGSPYRGLLPFGYTHQGVFYGRERLTDELIDAVADRLDGRGLLLVTGASGVGKSSLVQAGLLPAVAADRLAAGSRSWPRIVMTPTHHPVDELATRLAALAGVTAASVRDIMLERPDEVARFIRQVVITATITGDRAAEPESAVAPRLLLVIDQFEELFTLIPDTQPDAVAEREAFLAALCAAATTGVGPANQPALLVVITVRSDFWHHCLAIPALGELMRDGQFLARPMTEPELRRAILGPATAAGLRIEPELAELVLADLRAMASPTGFDAGALPLLSQAMLITWEHRHGDRLTLQSYSATGGVANAITTSAERVYTTLATEDQATTKTVFHQLATINSNGQATRRTATRATLYATTPHTTPERIDAILDAFADERLLVLNNGDVDIAHDSLLTAWHRLQDWLAENYTDHLIHRQLTDDTTRWQQTNHDKAFLYRGTELTNARKALTRWTTNPDRYPQPTPDIHHFIHTSTHTDRRTTNLRRTALSVLVLLVIATSITSFIAVTNAREASHQQALARSRELATEAEALTDSNPRLAQQRAAQAWHTAHTDEARNAMRTILTAREDNYSQINAYFSLDGKIFTIGDSDHGYRFWDVASRHQIREFTYPTHAMRSFDFTPDGKILVAYGGGTAWLWDVASRRRIGELTLPTGERSDPAFSSDSKTIAFVGGGTIWFWDVASRHQIRDFTYPSSVESFCFSPDGRTIVFFGGGKAWLWDVASRLRIGEFTDPSPAIDLDFSFDSKIFAFSSGDKVWLWDVLRRRGIGEFTVPTDAVWKSFDFSPDSNTIAFSGGSTAWLWDVASRRRIGEFTVPTGVETSFEVSPDSKIVAFSGGGTAWFWDVASRRRISEFTVPNRTDSFEFSPDGKTLTIYGDHTAWFWDVASRRRISEFTVPNRTNSFETSPDGKTLTIYGDHTAWFWDVTSRRRISEFTVPTGIMYDFAFSPDGRTLAAASADLTVRVWDVASRRQIGEFASTDIVKEFSFSPNSKILATFGVDDKALFWDVASRRQIGKFPS